MPIDFLSTVVNPSTARKRALHRVYKLLPEAAMRTTLKKEVVDFVGLDTKSAETLHTGNDTAPAVSK